MGGVGGMFLGTEGGGNQGLKKKNVFGGGTTKKSTVGGPGQKE